MGAAPDYYHALGVPRDATPDEIRSAYFDAARHWHPDANSDPEAQEHFIAVQKAYEVLSNAEKRKSYDAKMADAGYLPSISLKVQYSRSSVPLLDEPQLAYVLLEVMPTAEMDPAKQTPLNLSLVIDHSTSMKGERMDMVKANIAMLLQRLAPKDFISVVAFSDFARVIVPSTRVMNMERLMDKVAALETAGGTEIFQGLEAGVEQLRQRGGKQSIRHLILLTDGHTYGDEERCYSLAREAAAEGIVINALGIGDEWNDSFLDRLTGLSGGTVQFIGSRKDLSQFFEQRIFSMGQIYAKSIKFDFHLSPGAQLEYAMRLSPEVGPLPTSSPIMLGNLQYNRRQVVLFEFLLQPIPKDVKYIRFTDGALDMEIPSDHKIATFDLNFRRPVSAEVTPELPPGEIIDAMARLTLYRLQERARQEVEAGNIAEATKHLQYLATHLLAHGDRELAHVVLVEAEHIQQSHSFSKVGDKQIKIWNQGAFIALWPGVFKMILCPNCHHNELAGSLFCSECGAQLITTGHLTTQSIRPNSAEAMNVLSDLPPVASTANLDRNLTNTYSLHLMESGKVLQLTGRNEYSLGRAIEGQPLLPDIDLSAENAYALGVSRVHATLKITAQGLIITDLGSSNGTRVNGLKIVPHIEYPVNHGDVVSLGKLKMQVLIRK